MRSLILKLAAAGGFVLPVLAGIASPTVATAQTIERYQAPGDVFYREPVEAQHGLRFADLEAAMPTDPLTWSSDPGWQLHRTPDDQLAEATGRLRAAIPVGTSSADAAAILQRAGAQCGAGNPGQMMCRYRDAETPYAGQYFDNVQWRVWLDVDGGRVSHLAVTRDWTRR